LTRQHKLHQVKSNGISRGDAHHCQAVIYISTLWVFLNRVWFKESVVLIIMKKRPNAFKLRLWLTGAC